MERKEYLFTDVVSGERVWKYIDCYGEEWMAGYFRYRFRVGKSKAIPIL